MKTLHTPGPWFSTFNHFDAIIIHSGGASFSIAQVPNKWRSTEQNEANARLIAAAPELLEALQSFLSVAEGWTNGVQFPTIINAKAAIAKATGEKEEGL